MPARQFGALAGRSILMYVLPWRIRLASHHAVERRQTACPQRWRWSLSLQAGRKCRKGDDRARFLIDGPACATCPQDYHDRGTVISRFMPVWQPAGISRRRCRLRSSHFWRPLIKSSTDSMMAAGISTIMDVTCSTQSMADPLVSHGTRVDARPCHCHFQASR